MAGQAYLCTRTAERQRSLFWSERCGCLAADACTECKSFRGTTFHVTLFNWYFAAIVSRLARNTFRRSFAMGTPSDYLPQSISKGAINALLRSIGLPEAITIVRPKVTAQYHSIYFITLPPNEISQSYPELVLWVSGRYLPKIKTSNEVGVMT